MQSLANPDKYVVTPQGKNNGDVDWSVKGLTSADALTIQEFLLHKITTLDPTNKQPKSGSDPTIPDQETRCPSL
jgi:rhamnogalacturonan endolyase